MALAIRKDEVTLINLSIPSDSEIYYLISDGYLVGPIGTKRPTSPQQSSFRSSFDDLSGSKGNYGENGVNHSKLSGDIRIVPALVDITPSPTSVYEDQCIWSYKAIGSSTKRSYTLANGVLSSGYASMTNVSSIKRTVYVSTGSPYDFDIYFISYQVFNGLPYKLGYSVTKKQYRFNRVEGNYAYYDFLNSFWTGTLQTMIDSGINFGSKLSFAEISKLISLGTYSAANSNFGTAQFPLYLTYTVPQASVVDAIATVNSHIVATLRDINFPLRSIDYGELAFDAAKKFDANKVNMIAFLRDLRHPLEMIPKLKNLGKLKTLASNYLAVEYGILPTVSDLQSIWEALHRVGPYIDRNGFETFNAAHFDSSKTSIINFFLEQRIKIAVDREDSDFLRILNQIESIGFLPNLQNIWDLIPYSFVIDWFVNIGDLLERVDTRMRILRMDIPYTTMSSKETLEMPIGANFRYSFVGNVSLVRYSRWTSDQCPVPPLSLSGTNSVTNHWLEAGALIAQRTH